MKVALNMATLRGAGSSAVGKGVLEHLCKLAPEHQFLAWTPDDWELHEPATNCRIFSVPPGIGNKFATENLSIRQALRREKVDALFSLGDTGPPFVSIPHLLLVQQAYLAYRPNEWGFQPPPAFRAKMKLAAYYFRLGLRGVTAITVQTEDMKSRLCERWNILSSKVHVVPSALSFDNTPVPEKKSDIRYLCYVATPAPHKNFTVLADMMAALGGDESDLLCDLTVQRSEVPALVSRAEKLGVLHRFRFLGRISHSQCRELIANAQACVIPSLLESFGLLYYEAMALGTPIVSADRSFAREACGDYARYTAGHNGIGYAIQIRNILRDESSTDSSNQTMATTWRDASIQYLGLLESLTSN